MSAPALTLVPPRPISLYELSSEIQCLLDTRDMVLDDPAAQAELDAQIATFQEALPKKVDAVCRMLNHLESEAAKAKTEAARLVKRQKHFEAQAAVLESYCVRVLESLPEPKKGPRKLEGEHNTLKLSTSEQCKILDESMVPMEYKTVTAKMPADLWREVIDEFFPETLEQIQVEISVRLADVKKALKSHIEVEGADLIFPKGVQRS